MSLELRKDSKWWYGRFKSNNQRVCIKLGVEIKGTPPKSLREEGDGAFERSRAKAQAKLDGLIAEAHGRTVAERHLEKLYELKAGEKIGSVPLEKIAEAWDRMPVKRRRSERYVEMGHSFIRSFVEFLTLKHVKCKAMSDVTPKMARGFLLQVEKNGVSGRTWNSKLILLRSVFRGLSREAGLASNPFTGIPTKDEETIHRQPFSEEELHDLLEAADDFMHPIIVTGMCTAMRLGDCCMLEWESIDFDNGFLVVKTSKTGETAEIPLFPMLNAVVSTQKKTKSPYVFHKQAEVFRKDRHALSRGMQATLKQAGIKAHAERKNGTHKNANVKDFHSFRTTWITLALSAGVPMELLRRVTGHATVDVVLKHYFRPGRDEFRKALTSSMPKLITGEQVEEKRDPEAVIEEITELAKNLNGKNWKEMRKAILAKTE